MSLQNLSAKQLCDKIAAGQIGSVEATKVVFKNIDEREPAIGAYVSTCRDRALEKAAEVDKRIDGSEMENSSMCRKYSMIVPSHNSQGKTDSEVFNNESNIFRVYSVYGRVLERLCRAKGEGYEIKTSLVARSTFSGI